MTVVQDKFNHQGQMLANKVKKRFRHLYKRYNRQQISVFRLYDWDIPEIRAVVDWYDGHLVIGEYRRKQSTPDWLPLMGTYVAQALNVPEHHVHLKIRKAGIKEGKRYERLHHHNEKMVVQERALKFYINPTDYVDTGLFSDHRNTRQMIQEMANGRRFLNLYCYTGTFTCYAARGGAIQTVSVDRSQTAIEWTKENLQLNRLMDSHHHFVQQDTQAFLKTALQRYGRFDLAVVDPPSYSTTRVKNHHVDIARDYPQILNQVFALMAPGARVFFSTNHQNFTLETRHLHATDITEITQKTIPEDYITKHKQIHRCWEIVV